MKQMKEVTTTTFMTGHEDFFMDIVSTTDMDGEQMYEVWLWRENTGYKMFVVGEYKKSYPEGMTVREYALSTLKYLKHIWDSGLNLYMMYDENVEDMEVGFCEREKQEKARTRSEK